MNALVVSFIILFLLFTPPAASQGQSSKASQAVKKAENSTLVQDRLLACYTLFEAHRKSKGADAAFLKERLFYFSKNYYSDKGFQNFLVGKDFLEKEKYQEAVDKFTEADETEKSNTEVLHNLSLALFWTKKIKLAVEANVRALQINPLDDELSRDKLALEIASDSWAEALVTADAMVSSGSANALDYYFRGIAAMKLGKLDEAKKNFDTSIGKDKSYAEAYYYMNELQASSLDDQKLILKYNELCKTKKINLRDPSLCSRAKEKIL